MSDLKLEWTEDMVFLVLAQAEMELTREEAEGLFVTLGHALQDMDKLREEKEEEEQVILYSKARQRSSEGV